MKKVFISYSRDNLGEVTYLVRELKSKGIRPWQDIKDLPLGHQSEEKIRQAIYNDCDASLFYFTPRSLDSDYIFRIELPIALKRYREDPQFGIIPALRDVSFREVGEITLRRCGVNIATFNGITIPSLEGVNESDILGHIRPKLGKVAGKVLEVLLKRYSEIFNSRGYITFDLHSKQRTGYPKEPDLDIDLLPFFLERGKEIIPNERDWNGTLIPSLRDIKDTLTSICGLLSLHIRAKCHLSFGMALGFVFRATTGFHLEVEHYGQIWTTNTSCEDLSPLTLSEISGEINSKGLAIELCITEDVSEAVDRIVKENNKIFRTRIRFKPKRGIGRGSIPTGQHALAMSKQVAEEIRRIRREKRTETTHIFAAMPLGLGILLGYQFNACGPIQCYEYDNQQSTYVKTCFLT